MKKQTPYLVKTTFVLFAMIALVSCNNKTHTQENMTPPDIEEPANIIPINQAKEMYDTYSERVPILKKQYAAQGVNYNPTRYVEYELDDIKHYIDYIESEASRAGVKVGNLRIYLGAYPNQDEFENSGEPVQFPRQESIFITPTTANNGKQMAFFTRGKPGEKKRFPVFTEGMGNELRTVDGCGNKKINKASFLPFTTAQDETDDHSLTMNRGNVIPPPKKDDDFGGL